MGQSHDVTRPEDNPRWPKGPQVSRSTLIGDAVFMAIFVAVVFVTGSFFVLYGFLAIAAVVATVRLIRGKPLIGMIAGGDDYSDDYRVEGGRIIVSRDDKTWSEPLDAYEGVLWRSLRVRRGITRVSGSRRRHSDLFHIVELRHVSDRDRDVNIYTSREPAGQRARCEAAAEAFGLPMLRDAGDGTILRREVGELGRTLRELAADGRLDPGFHRSLKVPSGGSWRQDGNALELRLARAAVPQLLVAVPFLAFAVFVGFMVPADPLTTVVVIAAPCAVYALWVAVGFRVHIAADDLAQDWRLGPMTLWRRRLPLAEVEEVVVLSAFAAWSAVAIETDRNALRLAPLDSDLADWAARFLRAAIADAPARPEDAGRR